jgi:hypothetical protein
LTDERALGAEEEYGGGMVEGSDVRIPYTAAQIGDRRCRRDCNLN